jgi:hypothetical protein
LTIAFLIFVRAMSRELSLDFAIYPVRIGKNVAESATMIVMTIMISTRVNPFLDMGWGLVGKENWGPGTEGLELKNFYSLLRKWED